MGFKSPISHTTSFFLHWCPCCGQKCAALKDTAQERDLLPTPEGLQPHTKWGLDFLLCFHLADLHHHSPAEAFLGNRVSPLNSSVCSALLYSGESAHLGLSKGKNWIWMSRENPQNSDSKGISCSTRLTAIHGTMFNAVFQNHLPFSSCLCCMVGPRFWSHVCTELCTTEILSKVALRPPSKK